MAISITHPYISAVAEGPDSAKVRPSNWNAAHTIQQATDRLLGRDTAGTGTTEELTVSGGIEFTGSVGIQTSAFSGDVTKSAGGTALTIVNDAVTYAKIQNVSVSKLLGRGDSGSGDPQEITLGTNLSITGTTINASSGATERTQRSVTSGPVTIVAGDDIINLNISTPTSISLPVYSTRTGRPLTFKDVGGIAATYNITLTPNGAETIDGAASFILVANRQAITLVPFNDGVHSGWFLI